MALDPLRKRVRRALRRLRLERREALVALESQLKDPLVLHVLEVLLPEVDDRHALRQVVPEQRARRLREQDLAAVARRADARRANDVEAEVALVADGRLAGVQAHAHPHLGPLRPGVRAESPLSRNRAGDRLRCAREGVEERVALRVDLRAALRAQVLAEEPAVLADDFAVVVAELLEQPRRALDVGEEERDRAAGKCCHTVESTNR